MVADWLESCDLPDAKRLCRRFTVAQQAIHVQVTIPPTFRDELIVWLIYDLSSCKYACGSTKRVQDSYVTILDMFLDELSNINLRRMESHDLARALIFNILRSSLLSLCGLNHDLLPRCRQTIEFSKKIRGRFQYDRSGIVAEEYVECRMTTLRWLKSFNSDEDRQIRELVRSLKNFVPEELWWYKFVMLLLRW
ncbi:hypothetical protein PQX77_009141 [Marasmius sp. AFHP31]|nr:hypothetical protein PQX77_009141 [Marasmius sp. AFHP31]